jgi:sugar phosphate isomerase/epimerase
MFRSLGTGALGIRASLAESLELAKAAGFQGVSVSMPEASALVEERSVDYVKGLFQDAGLRMGNWGLPIKWQASEDEFQRELEKLWGFAALGQALGCTRVDTWILPFSEDRPFDENFAFHVRRFRPIAEILRDHGCRLGLEFVGPKTMRAGKKHAFICTMAGILDLCDAIGTGNVGLLLDAFHWYTSHGSIGDLQGLTADQVVTVHINDAPTGVPVDEQIDNVRCLPGETGVIDLVGFLRALDKIGYQGPVMPEPFSDMLKDMSPLEAAQTTGRYLLEVWRAARP